MTTGKLILIYISAGIFGIVAAAFAACCFDIMKVSGTAMEPEIGEGSHVVVSRMAYFWGTPDAGDVVAFPCSVYSEDGEDGMLVRRVAACEGDTVEIRNGNLYVNGSIYKGYENRGIYLEDMEKTTVGRGRVFVLSDTGQAVLDSRDQAVGQLMSSELEGRVLFK